MAPLNLVENIFSMGVCSECDNGKTVSLSDKKCQFHSFLAHSGTLKTKSEEKAVAKEIKAKKPIAKRSDKEIKRLEEYNVKNEAFAKANPECKCKNMVNETGLHCYGKMQTHHLIGRIAERLIDFDNCIRVCAVHHNWIEMNPKEAKELKLSINRL